MAIPEQLQLLLQGVEAWKAWWEQNESMGPDLAGANLAKANFGGANLRRAGL